VYITLPTLISNILQSAENKGNKKQRVGEERSRRLGNIHGLAGKKGGSRGSQRDVVYSIWTDQ
jgi:hypothetical protein